MENSVVRQTPVAAFITLVTVTVACCVRGALHPYPNEVLPWVAACGPSQWLAAFGAEHPVWSTVTAAVLFVVTGMIAGQMGVRFELYPKHCLLPMPLYAVAACGIFMGGSMLVSAVASLLTALALYCICSGYLRDQDLSMMMYGGMCIGTLPLVYPPAAVCVAIAVAAIFMFSLSAREVAVLLLSMLFVPLALCYGVWALGGEFLSPVKAVAEALTERSAMPPFGFDAAGGLFVAGLFGFMLFCAIVHFIADRYAAGVKPRGILVVGVEAFFIVISGCFLPSSDSGIFAVAAVPASIFAPLFYLGRQGGMYTIFYCILLLACMVHLFVY